MHWKASEMHSIAEVQTTFHWNATFSGAPFAGFEEDLQKQVTTIDLPSFTHDKCDINIHGYNCSIPGIVRYGGTINLVFFENVNWKVVKCFRKWLDSIYGTPGSDSIQDGIEDVNGLMEVGFEKCFGEIILEPEDKLDVPKAKFHLRHCLLTQLTVGQLTDGSGPDYFKPQVTVEYAMG